MKNKFQFIIAVLLSATLILAGCATSQVAKDAKGTGVKKVYDKPVSTVWDAMKVAVTKTGGEIAEENEQDCSLFVNYGVSLISWGERVGISCTKTSKNKTETEVVSKRALSINVTAEDWTEEIYKILDEELN